MRPGEVAFDRFEIEAEAGAGGMGVVYRARDRETGERVALKIMHGLGGDTARRFEREAELLAEIAHPGIVRHIAHGPSWIAMEWLEGEDLEQRMSREALTLQESVALARAAALALGAAHARGVVHRDVKPANLWLVDGEPARVKLLDFGIARAVVRSSLTAVGAVIGTPAYMAPEQARGARELDARADVFSLGCVLFECIAGRPAFVGEGIAAVLAKVLLEEVPPLGEVAAVPVEVEELVARMLSKEPAARPADGAEVVRALLGLELTEVGTRDGPSRVPPSLGRGEQRLAPVVLIERAADLAATLEARAAETAIDVVEGGALAAYRRVAREHGGRAEALAEGSVVVALEGRGAPTDQARSAASCALALAGAAPGAKLALATGRATAEGPRPVGDALDRAARLLRAPRPERGLRVDQVTAGLLDARFEVEGDAAGLSVVSLRERQEEVRTVLGKPTPCVGRDADLALLESAMARAVDDETSGAVIVTAPAGAGKTRLAHEFLQRLRARPEVQVWIGRGDAMTEGASFVLCAQMVRAQAGVQAGEALESRRDKLRARVERHLQGAVAARVTDFLGEMIGTEFPENALLRNARRDAMTMGDQIRRAWVDFVEAESSAGPLLLVLDDLHWADVGTVECVSIALGVCREKPLLALAMARQEVEEKFPKLWASRNPTAVRLGGLPRKQVERLVREVLGEDTDAATVARIVEHAEGNAFSLEELVRAAAEGETRVPETVLGMVEARLGKLDAEARRVLRAASVFGQTLWGGAVAALLGGEERSTHVGLFLEMLERGEWIAARTDSSVRGETEYRFRHALVREAAYAMLTDEDRRLGHALAGEWLERSSTADAATLAEHFEKGGDLGRAAALWARAAEEALEGNALGGAIACAGRGEACGAEGDLLGRLRLVEAEACFWRGENARALAAAEEAASRLPEGTGARAEALSRASTAAFRLGERERARGHAARLGAEVERAGVAVCEPAAWLALNLQLFGQREDAAALLARVERLAGASADDALRGVLHTARAQDAMMAGDPASCAEILVRAVTLYERAGRTRQVCLARVNLGFALMEFGRFDEAEERLRAALSETEPLGLLHVRAAALHNLGWALARKGALDEAAAVEEEAIRLFAEQGDRRMEGASRLYMTLIALARGELERAEAEAATAVDRSESAPTMRAYALAVLAAARLRRGRTPEALATAREASAWLSAHGADEGEVYIRLACAEIEHAGGDRAAAREQIGAARHRLLERAAKIGSEAAREDFFTLVPEHERTLALAREWLGA